MELMAAVQFSNPCLREILEDYRRLYQRRTADPCFRHPINPEGERMKVVAINTGSNHSSRVGQYFYQLGNYSSYGGSFTPDVSRAKVFDSPEEAQRFMSLNQEAYRSQGDQYALVPVEVTPPPPPTPQIRRLI